MIGEGLIAPPPADEPRILLYDIETTPLVGLSWEFYKTDLLTVIEDSHLLCFSYQWWRKSDIGFVSLPQNPSYHKNKKNDRWVAERLHFLLDQADALVAHNGHRFDRRKANLRFSVHGLGPPSPYVEVDTLTESRRYFAPYSHRLNELGRIHGFGEKKKHEGLPLWMACMKGDLAAWGRMEEYSRQDLVLLGEWYERLLPWIGSPGHQGGVNLALWSPEVEKCPKCGYQPERGNWGIRRGKHRSRFSEWHTIECKSCGGYSRDRARERQHVKAV